MDTLYKRNAQGKPIFWNIKQNGDALVLNYGLVLGNNHKEVVSITRKDELNSRFKAKRKEGYKLLSELKDSSIDFSKFGSDFDLDSNQLFNYLDTYLPKNSTTEEGFVLPMLAKTLEDNKPFSKNITYSGQWKINGLRCLIGMKKDDGLFEDISLTYHSREGTDWTAKMKWMDEILLQYIDEDLKEAMIKEGAMLDGELYLPGYSVNDINSFVKNVDLPQHYQLQFWCYDIAIDNMSYDCRTILKQCLHCDYAVFNNKEQHLNNKVQVLKLNDYHVSNFNEAIKFRDEFIEKGFEGLIIRNDDADYQFGKRNSSMYKFKRFDDGLFVIIDIKSDKRGLPIFVLKNDINSELFESTYNTPQEYQRLILANKDKYITCKALVEFRERSGVNQLPFHAKIVDIKR